MRTVDRFVRTWPNIVASDRFDTGVFRIIQSKRRGNERMKGADKDTARTRTNPKRTRRRLGALKNDGSVEKKERRTVKKRGEEKEDEGKRRGKKGTRF
jgi:hypothetical protein